jgi:hypothetical protein
VWGAFGVRQGTGCRQILEEHLLIESNATIVTCSAQLDTKAEALRQKLPLGCGC